MNPKNSWLTHSLLWHASIACFLIAVLTGFLYRVGMLGWVPGNLSLGNIRHAHSHLMFFGWAVPLPLYIFLYQISSITDQSKNWLQLMYYALAAELTLGLLAYPFFLFYGYRPVQIGSLSLPLSVIISGLVMVCWYIYLWGYLHVRSYLKKTSWQAWFDGALLMLVVSSLGAWGIAILQAVGPSSHLFMEGLTHFFLATFTEGWVVLALITILITQSSTTSSDSLTSQNLSLACIAIGAPLTFPYGISESLLSPILLIVARAGGLLTAIGLIAILYTLISSAMAKNRIWIWPILLLSIKAGIQIIASVMPSSFWLSDHALRILYLHILLLGGFTLGVIGYVHINSRVSTSYYYGVVLSVCAVLISLLLPSPLWPTDWSGLWVFYALAITAIFPVVAVLVEWVKVSIDHSKHV
ncbi:hypothetical protein [Fodinibius sp. Rm-B-1B1-1]|uniref:hypothetical protein n=1 Tax=Fodinibius alkaliphilus TaxID=3140241 RepID=UPI003159A41A